MLRAAGAAGALPVRGDLNANAVGAEMRDLAEKIDGSFGIAIFEFAIGGAHAAKRANLAIGADGFTRGGYGADFLERAFPTLAETGVAKIGAILVRENANGHLTVGIDGTPIVAAAAGVTLAVQGYVRESAFVFEKAEILVHASGIAEFEGDGLLGGKADVERALGAIRAGIDEGVKFEFDAEIFFGETFHLVDFVNINGGGDGFELEGKATLEEIADAVHAAIKGAGNAGEGLVRVTRGAVKRDFDGKGAIFGKMIGDSRGDHGAVGEKGDKEALLFRQGVNVEKILAGKDFTAGEEDPQTTGLDEFVEQVAVFFKSEFTLASLWVAHGQIVVTMLTFERAAVGDLDRDFGRHTTALVPLVHLSGEITVSFSSNQFPFSIDS